LLLLFTFRTYSVSASVSFQFTRSEPSAGSRRWRATPTRQDKTTSSHSQGAGQNLSALRTDLRTVTMGCKLQYRTVFPTLPVL